jgi:hypothetical protein
MHKCNCGAEFHHHTSLGIHQNICKCDKKESPTVSSSGAVPCYVRVGWLVTYRNVDRVMHFFEETSDADDMCMTLIDIGKTEVKKTEVFKQSI